MQLTHIQPTQLIIFPELHLFSSLAVVAVAHFLLSPAHSMAGPLSQWWPLGVHGHRLPAGQVVFYIR